MIFISYRRSDGKAIATLIKQSLINKGFAEEDIFLDLHDILCEDHVELCSEVIRGCCAFILIITKDSFVSKDEPDYYYDEISQALDENKKVIPVAYETFFNGNTVPPKFKDRNLHRRNALKYDIEYQEASTIKLIDAIAKGEQEPFHVKLAHWLITPFIFIAIYIGITFIGGVIRYVWDNYWLSEATCVEYASKHLKESKDNKGTYYYETSDKVYIYDSYKRKVDTKFISNDSFSLEIGEQARKDASIWVLAAGMVHEMSKSKIKPHGNKKHVIVIAAVTVGVASGLGLGFVIERMIFPVYDSKIICSKLESPDWWNKIIQKKEDKPLIKLQF